MSHFTTPPRRRPGMISLTAACAIALVGFLIVGFLTWRATRPAQTDGRTEIVVWNLYQLGPSIELALHQFERANPQYKVVSSASISPNTTADGQRLLTAIAGGVPPDMMLFDRFAIPEWAARGALTDLRPMLAAQTQDEPTRIRLDEYYPWTIAEGSYRAPAATGEPGIYGIPITVDCRLLFSNANHLRQAGMVDAAGDPRPPRTWEELRDLASKLTIRDPATGGLIRLGFAPNVGNSWLYLYAWQAGGELLNTAGTTVQLDTPPVRRALRFMVDLFDDAGGAARVNAFQSSFQAGGPLDPFLTGQVSLKIDTTASLQPIVNFRPDMDFITSPAPIPGDRVAAGERPITWAGGFSFIIPAGAQQAEGAFKLIQFLTSADTYRSIQQTNREAMAAEGRLFLPEPSPNRTHFEALEREWIAGDPKVPPRIKQAYAVIREMLPTAKIRPPSPIGQVLWNQHVRAMDAATNHQFGDRFGADRDGEVQYALASMQRDAQAQLDAFLQPPPPHVVRWSGYFLAYGALIAACGVAMFVAYRRGRRTHGYHRREVGAALLFASPWIVGVICLTGGPILFSVVTSFTNYDVLNPARYVGLANYRGLLNDDVFYASLGNTAYMLLRLPLVMGLGLAIAMMLNRSIRGIGAYRTAFFMPSIVPVVASSLLWILLLNPNFGAINNALSWLFNTPPAQGVEWLIAKAVGHRFEFAPPNWLQDASWSKPSLILMSLWGAGGGMIIWLAGLQSIPRQLYEAAEIDGASAWGQFRNVTLPMLSPYILFNAIVGVIATMQIFTEAYIMTTGGPADSTLFYAYYLFRNAFQYFRMGYASALAWILFLIVFALTLVQLWASRKWVHYERA